MNPLDIGDIALSWLQGLRQREPEIQAVAFPGVYELSEETDNYLNHLEQ